MLCLVDFNEIFLGIPEEKLLQGLENKLSQTNLNGDLEDLRRKFIGEIDIGFHNLTINNSLEIAIFFWEISNYLDCVVFCL